MEQDEKAEMRHKHALAKLNLEKVLAILSLKYSISIV